MLIRLKSNRSKKQPKQFKKQKQQRKSVSKEQPTQQSWLGRMLDIKESQWHDDDYDAGKDW